MNWNWSDGLIIGGALTGVAVAADRWLIPDFDPYKPLPRVDRSVWGAPIMIGWYAAIIATVAETPRGFLYLLLEPLGACLIVYLIADIIIGPRALRRQQELIRKWESGEPYP